MTKDAKLAVLTAPDLADTHDRYRALKQEIDEAHRLAWIGGLVSRFTNEELRLLADTFCIWETLALRDLGLLGPDEGYDGRKKPNGREMTND